MQNFIINEHGDVLCYISADVLYELQKRYSIEEISEMFHETVRII